MAEIKKITQDALDKLRKSELKIGAQHAYNPYTQCYCALGAIAVDVLGMTHTNKKDWWDELEWAAVAEAIGLERNEASLIYRPNDSIVRKAENTKTPITWDDIVDAIEKEIKSVKIINALP